jgi:hypothetical protein
MAKTSAQFLKVHKLAQRKGTKVKVHKLDKPSTAYQKKKSIIRPKQVHQVKVYNLAKAIAPTKHSITLKRPKKVHSHERP